MSLTQHDRFWSKVNVGQSWECWEWLASKMWKGYGQFSIDGKNKRAHRVSWELVTGPIPYGAMICHSCDNPGCVNPAHLCAETQSYNMLDASEKGRLLPQSGEHNSMCKITDAEVKKIKDRIANGVVQHKIAAEFNISQQHVSDINTGRRRARC